MKKKTNEPVWKTVYKHKPIHMIPSYCKTRILTVGRDEALFVKFGPSWYLSAVKPYSFGWMFPSSNPSPSGYWKRVDVEYLYTARIINAAHANRILNDCYKDIRKDCPLDVKKLMDRIEDGS